MKKIYSILVILLVMNLDSYGQVWTTFSYTGSTQFFTVPAGVTAMAMVAKGARGGLNSTMWSTTCSSTLPDTFGKGACVSGKIPVTGGTVLTVFVGGKGTDGTVASCVGTPGVGGWNGGGDGGYGYGSYAGGGGGGASDVRSGGVGFPDRLIVAAGGGGAGGNYYTILNAEKGGDGGTLTGEDGYGNSTPYSTGGAQGGSPTAGGGFGSIGAPWADGQPGALGIGGDAGTGVAFSGSGGGGGGGGYYGGGGGSWGGGGGGSSYTDPGATAVSHSRGCNYGDGEVELCVIDPGKILGVRPICAGLTLSLSSTVPGGTWSSSNTAIAKISTSGVVTTVARGTATITYSFSSPCADAYTTATLSVTAPDPITGNNIICVGTTGVFSDATSGGKWSISSTASASIGSTTGIVTGYYPGNPTITYTAATGSSCFSTLTLDIDGIAGPRGVCNGLTVPLVSSTGGGVWSSSNTSVATISGSGTTGLLNGIAIGTAIISYSSPVCPSTYAVTVNPIAPNSGVDSVCQGGTGFVTNIIGGGKWTSDNPPVAKVDPTTGLVTGMSGGTATMSYLLPTGCLSQKMVTVIPPAPPITGFFQACPGNSSALSDALPGGIWSSLNTSVATISSSGTVTAITPDTVSILYTIRPGCSTYTTFLVNPVPFPITGIDSLCPGVTDTLHNASIGGLWSTSTPLQDTVVDSNGIFTSRLPGTAVVRYTLPTGCFITKNIYIFPVPVPVVSYDPYSGALHLDKVYPKNYRYQWYDSITGLIPHATSPTLAGTYSQWYFVEITDSLGCKGRSGIYHFDSHQVGVKNIGENVSVHMYPNPVSGTLFIESSIKVRAVLSTMDGKIAIQQADAKQLDLSGLASAMYFISLYDESGQLVTVQKLVKE